MSDKIAIIGMAGRFPGAPDLPAFWDLLVNAREGLVRLGRDELLAEGVPAETLADPRYVPAAGMLEAIDRFDAGFWGIAGREAALMDPQQRIALETAWHALEDAAIDPRRADGAIGVFVGAAISTYLLTRLRDEIAGPSAPSQLLAMIGNDKDYIATQLAYRLDLTGPAIAVQTACSSSLVAVHLACQSLNAGECDIAIAGGVSVRVPHRVGYRHEAGGMLSPDGHCRSFAEDAAGTVFASGCGLVVLRRLDEAGHDRVRAVVLGSAVNNDGNRKVGFTAPSQDRQSAVIAEAMAVAGVAPADIGYVEGHGTATELGDPVEVMALASALRGAAPGAVALGSAKSTIGHAETAAGIAGLIKTVLMLEHARIAPSLHAAHPSRRIPWDDTPLRLATAVLPWTERRVAGVSSFGIGGTNAHVVLGAAPPARPPARQAAPRLLICAQDRTALAELTQRYGARVAAQPEDFPAICAAAARRPRLSWWIAADSPERLADAVPQTGPMPDPPSSNDGPPIDLPLYPFRRERHWFAAAGETRLLGPAIPTPFAAALYRIAIDGAWRGWLTQHVVAGEKLLPAALHLALFAEAADGAVSEVVIRRSLNLDQAAQPQLWRSADGGLKVMAQRDGDWHCLAEARSGDPGVRLSPWQVAAGEAIDGAAWAKMMAGSGLDFGPAFRLIASLRRDGGAVRAELDPTAPANPVSLLDAGLQALGAAVIDNSGHFRPVEIARLNLRGDIATARTILARLTGDLENAKTGDVLWLDEGAGIVAEAEGIVCRRVRDRAADMLYRLTSRPDPDPAVTAPYPELERIACSFARRALAAAASPARPELARMLSAHAARAEPEAADPEAACRALAARHPDHVAEIELVARCGAALADVLASRLDPLELLFGGRNSARDGAYRLSPLAGRLNRIAGAVAAAAQPRRVIEIGGGTAATTLELRAALPGVEEYLFTDISPAFLAEARRCFAGWPGFSTAMLDIARDPSGQDVPVGAWDLVVAANVLHATPDLAAALRHACRLLAPGGRLLLIEGTESSARLDITFGLTEGWMRRRDHALRPDHPLVSGAVWCELLRSAELVEPLVVTELGGQAVLTAAAGAPRWAAVGRDAQLAERLGLRFLPLAKMLPTERLDGVVALAGIEEAADPLRDLLTLSRALLERPDAPRLLVPTLNGEAVTSIDRPMPSRAALGGFARTLAREHPALRPRAIDLADGDLITMAIAVERTLDDGEDRVAWRDGKRLLARLERLRETSPAPASQRLGLGLDLSPMSVETPRPGPGEVVVRVRAAGINYKDALIASGQLPDAGAGLGAECAGEIAELGPGVTGLALGQAVVAVAGGALASHVRADARLVLPKPPQLDFTRAAAVPIAGVTAWYALRHLVQIAPGQRVLVHMATGGVGWFALRFAQSAGAEIVATAGSEAKRRVLAGLGIREIYSSRDTGFAAAPPVDVVLNALSGAARDAGLGLLRPGGRFIEIGRIGIATAEEVAATRPDIAYHLVALDRVAAPFFAALLREVLDAVAADPSLLPPVATVSLAESRRAFETMMRAEHIGKLVALPHVPAAIRGDGSYVVTGGLGGLGPEIASWLAQRSAGGVVLVARRAPAGAMPENVVIGDVADPATLRAVDARARDLGLPPVRGVVHAAGILDDALIEALDPASFDRVMAPKLGGVRAILDHWPDLELLVGFSSAGALLGSAGQAAHTATGAAMDAALATAAAAGRSAVAVDWGAWHERGAAAARGIDGALAAGMGSIATADGFVALDRVLAAGVAQAAVLPIDWPAMRAGGAVPALLRDLAGPDDKVAAAPVPSPAPPPAPAPMPAEQRREWLRERIAAECAGMLAIRGAIDPRRPLRELGLDSLAALELRNRLGRLCAAVLPAGLLFDYPTIAALTEHLATAYLGLPPERAPQLPSPDHAEDALAEDALAEDALADASDAELDAAISAFAALHGEAEP